MSRLLLATMPQQGHTAPVLPLARELVARGHDVRWYAGARFHAPVEASGARLVPMRSGDVDPTWVEDLPDRPPPGVRQLGSDLEHLFVRPVPGHVADLEAELAARPADAVVCDIGLVEAARALHERGGPPWATVGVVPLFVRSVDTAPFGLGLRPARGPAGRVRDRALTVAVERGVLRGLRRALGEVRVELGLPARPPGPDQGPISPFLHLQASIPSLEYPRRDLPPQVRFVGHLAPPSAGEAPAWADDLHGDRPVVLVTQGTVNPDPTQLLVPTVRALAGAGPLVVVAGAGAGLPVDPLPANVRVGGFLPFAELLPHVDVLVTNGGFGATQLALAAGVPVVVAGRTQDKAEVAARVAWAGAGVDLRTQTPTPSQVRRAVDAVLGDSSYRARARELAAEYARYDAPRAASDLLEELAGSGF